MKVVIVRPSSKRILAWTQRALFAGAISLLGYCGFVLADTWIFQQAESRQLERALADRPSTTGGTSHSSVPNVRKGLRPLATDGMIGRIEISRLGLSAIVMEGTTARTLRRAVGHIAGTALPGQPGNVGISGHRDTFFRPLRNIRQDDIITLTTLLGEFRYRVVSTKVVSPRETSVLNPTGQEILTLVTCHPFYFVGSAPDRFVVWAERVLDQPTDSESTAFPHPLDQVHSIDTEMRTYRPRENAQ